jgi:hypothetical protein
MNVISVVIFESTFPYKMAIVVEILLYKINSRRPKKTASNVEPNI